MTLQQSDILNPGLVLLGPCFGFYWLQSSTGNEKCIVRITVSELTALEIQFAILPTKAL
jgi:hypothetical protein